jgi:hypothetical protein
MRLWHVTATGKVGWVGSVAVRLPQGHVFAHATRVPWLLMLRLLCCGTELRTHCICFQVPEGSLASLPRLWNHHGRLCQHVLLQHVTHKAFSRQRTHASGDRLGAQPGKLLSLLLLRHHVQGTYTQATQTNSTHWHCRSRG